MHAHPILRRLFFFPPSPLPLAAYKESDRLHIMGKRVLVDVERPVHIRVRGQDAEGEAILIEASGLEARVIQHELDHLDGVLILDRTSRDQRKEAMRVLRERLDGA